MDKGCCALVWLRRCHLGGWLVQLFAAAVIYDFVAFAVHVMIHRSDALWNVHKVHHSSQHLDWLATTRTHMFELFVRNIPAQAILFTLGFSARTVAAAIGVYATFAVLGHSNLRLDLAAVEPLFVTPRLHRRHHVPATTQNNFGTIFSIWDRMFRLLVSLDTAVDEPLGVPGEHTTYPQRFHHAVGEPFRQNLARRAEKMALKPSGRHSSRNPFIETETVEYAAPRASGRRQVPPRL